MRYLDAHAVAALGPAAAVHAVIDALRAGLDPADDLPRTATTDVGAGHLLLMPSGSATAAGVKVASVAPGNPARGLPRIQATYLLLDAETLTLRAILDGTALTTLRTPAVSVAAVLAHLPERPLRLAVIGRGPQAHAHIDALACVRELDWVQVLGRDELHSDAIESADVIVCATSSRKPLFDSARVRADATVIAIGSHEPDARELDSALLARATVVVEDRATAAREAGDLVLARADGVDPELVAMRDLVTGTVAPPRDRPLVFKSVGMSWQDLVVAEAVLAHGGTGVDLGERG